MYSVILPTYKECGNLKILIPQLTGYFSSSAFPYEIVIIDDNSNDGTSEYIDSLSDRNIRLIVRKDKKGLSSAIIDGTDMAAGDVIVHMDSDLAHRVEDLGTMIACFNENRDKNNFIIGSRYHRESVYEGKPFLNRMASYWGKKFVKLYFGIRLEDTSNNFRVFEKKVWDLIRPKLIPDGNIMLVQIIYLAHLEGVKFKEMPIEYVERRIGESKLDVSRETIRFFHNIFKIKKTGRHG